MGRGESRILSGAEHAASVLRRAVGKSRSLALLSGYGRANANFRESAVGSCLFSPRGACAAKFRNRYLHALETSYFLVRLRAVLAKLLAVRVGSFAGFLLLAGAISFAGNLFRGETFLTGTRLWASLIPALAVLPAVHARKSLSAALREGILTGRFLLGYCNLSADRFGRSENGEECYGHVLFFGVLAGVLGTVLHPAVLLAGGIGACLALLLFAVPELGALVLLFGLPFAELLPHPTVTLFCAVLLSDLAWLTKALCGKRELRVEPVLLWTVLLAVLYAFGGIGTMPPKASFLSGMKMSFFLLSAIPIGSLLSERVWRVRADHALQLSAFTVSAFGILQYALGKAPAAWVDLARFPDLGGRVTSFFSNPNILAVFLLLTFPACVAGVAAMEERPRRRFFSGIAALTVLGCTVLTWSRGAWLGCLAEILVFLLLYSEKSLSLLFLAPMPLGAAATFLPRTVLSRFSSIGNPAESSIRYRLSVWRGTLRLLREHPFGIGTGQANFGAVYPAYAVSGTESAVHTHQIFLQIAAELGISGLICLLGLLFRFLQCVFFAYRQTDSRNCARLIAGFSAVFGCLVMGFFDYVWYHSGMFFLFFAIVFTTVSESARLIRNSVSGGEMMW